MLLDGPRRARHPGCLQTLQTRPNPELTYWSLVTTVIPKPTKYTIPETPWRQEPHLYHLDRTCTARVSEERDLCPPHETSAQRLQCQRGLATFPSVRLQPFPRCFPLPRGHSVSGREGSRVDRVRGAIGSGDSSGRGGTVHQSFPRTCGTECYVGQGSAAWPLILQRQGRAESKAPGGRGGARLAVGTGPRRRERRRPAVWWSSSGRAVPPLPPSGTGPGISSRCQSWHSRGDCGGAGRQRAQGLSRRRVPGHLSHRKGTRRRVKVAVKVCSSSCDSALVKVTVPPS